MYPLAPGPVKARGYACTRTIVHDWGMSSETQAFQRLKFLIERLREEDVREDPKATGPRRGWPGRVGKRLGISKELVQKISAGDRTGVRESTIDTVCAELKLDRGFFADELGGAHPDYREYVRGWEPPEFSRFRRVYSRWSELTEEERVRVKRMKFRNGRSVQNYIDQAELILGGGDVPLRREETEEKAAAEGVVRVGRKRVS
jgi:hypothetical protein